MVVDRDQRLGKVDDAGFLGRGRGMTARRRGRDFQCDVALLGNPDHHRRAVDHRGIVGDQPALVDGEQRLDLLRGQRLRDRRRPGAASLLVVARDQIDRAARVETLRSQCLDRLEQADQRALVVDRPAPPDRPLSHLAREGRVFPVLLGARRHRHDVLMGHDDDRLGGRVAARPRIEQRLAQRVAAHRGMGVGIGRGQPVVQLVPLRQLVFGRILMRHGLEPHCGGQMPRRRRRVEGRGRGDLDIGRIGHRCRSESRGA